MKTSSLPRAVSILGFARSGRSLARALRERGIAPTPRIVAVTGWGKPEDERRTREAGFDMHLIKPVEESKIRQVLRLRGPRPTRH